MDEKSQLAKEIKNYKRQISSCTEDIKELEDKAELLEKAYRKKEEEEIEVENLFTELRAKSESIYNFGGCKIVKSMAMIIDEQISAYKLNDVRNCYSGTREIIRSEINRIKEEIEEKRLEINRLDYKISASVKKQRALS